MQVDDLKGIMVRNIGGFFIYVSDILTNMTNITLPTLVTTGYFCDICTWFTPNAYVVEQKWKKKSFKYTVLSQISLPLAVLFCLKESTSAK